jgi:hypothetical protein
MEACTVPGGGNFTLAFAGRLQAGDYERLQVAAMSRPAEAARLAANWYKTYPKPRSDDDYELVPEQALALRLPNFEDGVYLLRIRGKNQERLPKATVGAYYLSVRGKLQKLHQWSFWTKAFKLKDRYFVELFRTSTGGDGGTLVFELEPAGAKLRLNDGSFAT